MENLGLQDVGHASVTAGSGAVRMPHLLKEVFKGIVRAISAHLFQKTFLDEEKTTQRRQKQKGGSRKKK